MSGSDCSSDLSLITELTSEAGALALTYFESSPSFRTKEGGSPVSEADDAVDLFLRERLMSARPDYGWLSEESADDGSRLSASRSFVVDPIDGTRGFLQKQPEWCVSVAIIENGRPIAGVLVAPSLNCTISATASGGVFVNGESYNSSPPTDRSDSDILVTGFDSSSLNGNWRKPESYSPSLAWRFALVATRALDGVFVSGNVHDWDIAAADLIVHESGGLVTNLDGSSLMYNESHPKKSRVLASSSRHPEMLDKAKEFLI